MARERGPIDIVAKRGLLAKNPEARKIHDDLVLAADAKVTNALHQRDIPENIKDTVRTAVRAARAYFHHLKIPVRLSEKDILQRCRFVSDDGAVFRDKGGNSFEVRPMPAAFYDTLTKLFVIHTPHLHLLNHIELTRILIHEIMHSVSHSETRIVERPTGGIGLIRASGYKSSRSQFSNGIGEIEEERFIGLNEAITDLMALRAISHSRTLPPGYIGEKFGNDGYIDEKNVLQIMCETIGSRIGKTAEEMERTFMQGYIDGTKMHLRIIVHHFGPGALQVLAKMGQNSPTSYHAGVLNSKVTAWFTDIGNEKRDELFQEIVNYPSPQDRAREARAKEVPPQNS